MVFVLNKNKKPVNMCHEATARILLKEGKAVVHKYYPFTIRLKNKVNDSNKKEYCLKIDPGSKFTGLAIVAEDNDVVFLAEIEHRGEQIVSNLLTKKGARRNRRQRKTRYRRCKFINHYLKKDSKYKQSTNRPEGWLPPSVQSIKQNIINFIKKCKKLCNVTSISIESVKFDTQLLQNPDISGVEYQQGTLFGYEIREYLLEKYGHTCQYCGGKSNDPVLEVEHMHSKYAGGSNSIRNLNLACRTCNQEKDSLTLAQWLKKLKASKEFEINKIRINRIEKILSGHTFVSLRYSAWVNAYRYNLVKDAKSILKNIELSSGGRTKYNRTKQRLPKEHYYDALCVGSIPKTFNFKTNTVLVILSKGRGSRFRGRTNKCGIITKQLPRQKNFFGFQTGDMVKAIVVKGKKKGTYVGRVAIRSSGYFNIQTKDGVVQGVKHSVCKLIQRNDGYAYSLKQRSLLFV